MPPSSKFTDSGPAVEPLARLPELAVLHHYRAYGMDIVSEFVIRELPALRPAAGDLVDLAIRRRRLEGPLPADGLPLARFTADSAYFAWSGLARFAVDADGIAVDPLPGVPDEILGMALLGPLMATVLQLRGRLVLHASAVASTGGRAAVFIGDKGAGKSTMAAAMVAAGCRLINDDVAALIVAPGAAPLIASGYSSVKLSREVLATLPALAGEVLPDVVRDDPKLRLRLQDAEDCERQLTRIYVLRRGKPPMIQSLDPPSALSAILRFVYMMKYGQAAFTAAAAAVVFRQSATVAGLVPVSVLHVPDGLDMLADAAAFVLRDLDRAPAPGR